MTALTFPSNPTVGQQYLSDTGTIWTWDGVKWTVGSLTPASSSESVVGPANVTAGQLFNILVAGGSPNTAFTVNITGPGNYSSTSTGSLDSKGNYIYTGQQFTALGTYTYTVTFAFDSQVKTYTFNVAAQPVVPTTVVTTYDPLLNVSFPTTPTQGQLYTLTDGTVYQWNGIKWVVYSSVTPASIAANNTTQIITNPYTLPKATSTTLGGVIVGNGIDNADGVISVNTASIAGAIETAVTGAVISAVEAAVQVPATASTLGEVKIGSNIDVTTDGTISVPTASNSTLGVVKAGTNISIDGNGAISVPTASNSTLGVVQAGTNVTIDSTGAINIATGAGINTLESISNVNPSGITDGSLLVYNAGASRWNVTTNLAQENWDSGQY